MFKNNIKIRLYTTTINDNINNSFLYEWGTVAEQIYVKPATIVPLPCTPELDHLGTWEHPLGSSRKSLSLPEKEKN